VDTIFGEWFTILFDLMKCVRKYLF